MSAAVDPWATGVTTEPWWRVGWLTTLNPLSKIAAPLPAMIAVIATRDPLVPLGLILLSLAIVVTGARLSPRAALVVLLGIPVALCVLTVGFGVWVDPARVSDSPVLFSIGDWSLHTGAFTTGFATAARLASIVCLSLIAGLTSTGPDLVRSLVQHARLPYRIAYTALAAYRFIPRFRFELDVIRQAHRVRGMAGGRGPIASLRRTAGYAVPLLASAIRHAERVALSMDSRAFGASRTRTERYEVPLRVRDAVFTVAMLVATAAIFVSVPLLSR